MADTFLGRCPACLDNAFMDGDCRNKDADCLERRARECVDRIERQRIVAEFERRDAIKRRTVT